MNTGIYMICWTDNSYFYIGQSKRLKRRKYEHLHDLEKGTHPNRKLQNVFNKYGQPKFKILQFCEVEHLNFFEQKLLNEFEDSGYLLNIAKCAEAPARGRTPWNKGKPRTEETKRKIREAKKGGITAKQKEAISKANSKPVEQWTMDNVFVKVWASATTAAKELKLQKSCINACCKEKQKSTGGFVWKYHQGS